MTVDLNAALDFMATHAKVLDRRRLDVLLNGADPAGMLAALDAYRNDDGGYGWGLEGDLRSTESQPGASGHAFETFAEAGVATPHAAALCDWLDTIALPSGALPMAVAMGTHAGSGPWWAAADPAEPSLQITAFNLMDAHRVARFDDGVATHPWLARATAWALAEIDALDEPPFAYVLWFCLKLVDALGDTARLERLGRWIPADGRLPVVGGAADEAVRPIELAPDPGSPARALVPADVIAADLDALASEQQDDGGWTVDFDSRSPAGSLEWRGYATVGALAVLRRNGRL